MTNLRLNRDMKTFVSSRNEIVKLDRKSRVKKINKDKVSAFRDSSMFKKFRAFVFEFESQFESKSQSESKSQRFVIDSFIVVSIVFASINNATLLRMFFQLLSFSFDVNSFSIASITIFVVFVIVSITIFEIIEIVNDLNMNDIEVLLKKNTIAHKQSCFDWTLMFIIKIAFKKKFKFTLTSLRSVFLFVCFFRVALFVIISRISRISIKRRIKISIVSKIDEFSRDSRVMMNDDNDEKFDVKNDNRSNCIRCCRISINCRHVTSIVCDKCFKQKITCFSIRFEFMC
jgi:hypothetical protein